MNNHLTRASVAWVALPVILLVTWCVYLPGLSGGFLFDDFINLSALGNSGPIDNWASFLRYVTSGTADPTGRPLALMSFLIDAQDWPADPRPFLRTNLILHLTNGALLFVLLRTLGRAIQDESESKITLAALLATALWLLHPLFVSTTLYVVQREAMLPTTFVLLGLIAFSCGRIALSATRGSAGTVSMMLGIGLGTTLALLCKANGVLLPLLAWVLESTVFRKLPELEADTPAATRLARVRMWLIVLPSLLTLAYLVHFLASWNSFPANRSWTVGQRLLSEPRILLEYLRLLLIPRSMSSGIFNDHYQASIGLFQPGITAISLLLVASSLFLAHRVRTKFPVSAAAILFFFAGHVLESSAVPLELYFEHRNYLPALLLFWPFARGICAWRGPSWIRILAASLLLALVTVTTAQRAQMWGQPERLATIWATLNPESSRAQAMAAMSLVNAARSKQAISQLAPRWRDRPYDLQIAASYFAAACSSGSGLSGADKAGFVGTIRLATGDQELLYRWLGDALETAAAGKCGDLTLDDVELWVKATGHQLRTREMSIRMRESLSGRIALYRNLPDQALVHFNKQLLAIPTPQTAATQAALLASRGYFNQALAHLNRYEELRDRILQPGPGMPWIHAVVLRRQGYWPQEMRWLRANFEAALKSKAATDDNAD